MLGLRSTQPQTLYCGAATSGRTELGYHGTLGMHAGLGKIVLRIMGFLEIAAGRFGGFVLPAERVWTFSASTARGFWKLFFFFPSGIGQFLFRIDDRSPYGGTAEENRSAWRLGAF